MIASASAAAYGRVLDARTAQAQQAQQENPHGSSAHYHGGPSLRTAAGIVCPQCEQPARGPAGHKPVPLPPKYRHALHAVYECRQCGLPFSPR